MKPARTRRVLMFDLIHGKAKPVIAWRQPPLLTHTLHSATAEGGDEARRGCRARRRGRRHARGVGAVGFSLADIEAPCISVVVVGNGDRTHVEEVAERIARQIWNEREDFVYRSAPLAESVAQAAVLAVDARQARAAARSRRQLHVGRHMRHDGSARRSLEAEARRHRERAVVRSASVAALMSAGVGSTVTVTIATRSRAMRSSHVRRFA